MLLIIYYWKDSRDRSVSKVTLKGHFFFLELISKPIFRIL